MSGVGHLGLPRRVAGLAFGWLIAFVVVLGATLTVPIPQAAGLSYDGAGESTLAARGHSVGTFDLPVEYEARGDSYAVGAHLRPAVDSSAPRATDANVVVGRRGASQTFVDDAGRSSTVRYGGEIRVAPGRNIPGVVNGRAYSGHAFDQMQARGIVPSVVDDTIATGVSAPSRSSTSVFYGAGNDVSVVVNSQGRVVTVSYGDLRP
jgi:hypothetical protein